MIRLQKMIAESGFCSRRKAEEYIKKGLVLVNGNVVTLLGTKVSEKDEITVDNQLINSKEEKEYFLLYKPSQVISSVKDDKMRQTVVDLIKTNKRIYPIGRLDYDTSGLLLLTNDGDLAEKLSHPSSEVEKIYRVKIKGILTPKEIKEIKRGIKISNRKVKVTYFKIVKINYQKETTSLLIGIVEGRNHIIKRLFKSLNHEVIKLKREAYAFLTLQGLRVGEYRKLTIKEVRKLYALGK